MYGKYVFKYGRCGIGETIDDCKITPNSDRKNIHSAFLGIPRSRGSSSISVFGGGSWTGGGISTLLAYL